MTELLINYATLLAFLLFSADLIYQIKQILKERSSRGVSILGLTARAGATIILLMKFITLQDTYLIAGQALFTLLVVTYLTLSWIYRKS